ncbi:MAG TPA: exodeoxyribonuclease V subunit alpha [Nocardioidaceae bacterium]|nr:exodeoxyribonuclease V subunit alpha [Nocardioidaceae bacterium]
MTELFEPTDAADRRLALSAKGVLRTFNEAGVLTSADVHVARRLAALTGEESEAVQLAVGLATRAVRLGSVCLDLATASQVAPELDWPESGAWARAVQASPLVAHGMVHLERGLLYLDRYHRQEVQVCADILARIRRPAPHVDRDLVDAAVERVFTGETWAEQRAACRAAAASWTTVLTGGPGTGKTSTVAGLLAVLAEQAARDEIPLRVALAAPTGKAAARLQEAVARATERLPDADRDRLGVLPASTLHRLLGRRPDNDTRFRHHRGNRLPQDVIVVDETSMVSLTMMTRLVEAVRPDARLILVGDPDQLASVEAGAVLADLVPGFDGADDSPVVTLRTSHRFGDAIGALATAIRIGDSDRVLALLRAREGGLDLVEDPDPAPVLRQALVPTALEVRRLAAAGDGAGAVAALDRHRLLCAHREGPFGVRHWNRQAEHWLSEATGDPLHSPMYLGRPLLVTSNDYGLGLYNGDTGVVVAHGDGVRAVIGSSRGLLGFAPGRISDVETMHAMTVHKSQGSQADEVTVLLPEDDSRLLSRELFYTAVTRARRSVRVVGSEAAVRAAVERRVQRASGLRQRLVR